MNGTTPTLAKGLLEALEFLMTAGAGAMGGAALAQKLQGFGLPPNLSKGMANLFSVHFGGIGRQDEANYWTSLGGLIQWEKILNLPAGTAQEWVRRLSDWAVDLLPAQKKSLVLTIGMLYGDISGTLQPHITGGTAATPTDEYQIRVAALEEAQRKAAETILLLVGAADKDEMTRIAIASRLIPARDYGHELHEWWSESWAGHLQSVQSARDMLEAARQRSQQRIDEIRTRVEDPTDGLNVRIRNRWNAWTTGQPARATARADRRRQRRMRIWWRIILFLVALGICIGLYFLTKQ